MLAGVCPVDLSTAAGPLTQYESDPHVWPTLLCMASSMFINLSSVIELVQLQ